MVVAVGWPAPARVCCVGAPAGFDGIITTLLAQEASVRIPVDGILEEFTCPICLMPITDCFMVVPCGHNGCSECLEEWIARAHTCPVCTAPDVTAAKLIKNHCFDSIFQKVWMAVADVALHLVTDRATSPCGASVCLAGERGAGEGNKGVLS